MRGRRAPSHAPGKGRVAKSPSACLSGAAVAVPISARAPSTPRAERFTYVTARGPSACREGRMSPPRFTDEDTGSGECAVT